MNASQVNLAKTIPFRKNELLLVECAGEPFVPMKPVAEGMGLAWQTQHRKLMSGRFSSTITEMVIVAQDGKQREMTCLPLRKLTGWLMSIHPNKVRHELRDGIIAYQNECDDVLWAYWNDGMAVRGHDRNAMTVIEQLIGMTEVNVLKGLIRDKAKVVPLEKRRSFQQTMHNRLHTRFNVPRVELIPAAEFEPACNFIAAYALEGEWLPSNESSLTDLNFPIEMLAKRRPEMIISKNGERTWLDVTLHDLRDLVGLPTPCEALLNELNRQGFDIEGAWWELRTYRNKLGSLQARIKGLCMEIEDPQRYAV